MNNNRLLVGLMALVSVSVQASDALAKGPFVYKKGDTWKMSETIVMPGSMQPDGTTSAAMASSSSMVYTVEKRFPDGSALVGMKVLSCKRGTSLTDLKDAPLPGNGESGYRLETTDGRSYLVQPKMTSTNPDEQAMMDQAGNTDEVAILRGSATTAKFLKVMRNKVPMDLVHVPSGPVAVGGKAKIGDVHVARQPDETLAGVLCQVFKCERAGMVETVWFDAKAHRVAKRSQTSGDPTPSEITQILLP